MLVKTKQNMCKQFEKALAFHYSSALFGIKPSIKCGMCEAQVCDQIRKSFNVKKVKSSRKKNETIINTLNDIYDADIIKCIEGMGYKLLNISRN